MVDPSFVHGVMPRTHIGRLELADAVAQLTHLFEIPLYVAQRWSIEDIKNSFTAFKASEVSADLWKNYVGKQSKTKPFDHGIIYSYYKARAYRCPYSRGLGFLLFIFACISNGIPLWELRIRRNVRN